MNDNFEKKTLIKGAGFLFGFILGLFVFVLLAVKQTFFTAIIYNLKEWDILAILTLIPKSIKTLSMIMLIWFFSVFIGILCLNNSKRLKNIKFIPGFFAVYLMTFIGFLFVPFVIFLFGLTFFIIYLVWGLAEFVNLFIFSKVAYIFFVAIDFLFNKILLQELKLTNFNQENKYMFFQIIIFFLLLPYTFRYVVVGFENLLIKIFGNNASFLLKPIRLLSINFFRYVTYIFAFFTYLMSFLWEVSGNIDSIKEGLLAFIIIDAVISGAYSSIVKKKKKPILRTCISLSRELEMIKKIIIRENLFSYNNCRVLVKQTTIIEEFYKKVKKHPDEKLIIIYEKIKRISTENHKYKSLKGISYKELYIEINRIQQCIDEYIVG